MTMLQRGRDPIWVRTLPCACASHGRTWNEFEATVATLRAAAEASWWPSAKEGGAARWPDLGSAAAVCVTCSRSHTTRCCAACIVRVAG